MTQVQGKFVAVPPVFEAIQWDGTLDGSMEIFDFINERTETQANIQARPIEFQTRVYGKNEKLPEAIIVLGESVINKEDALSRTLYPTMWLVYCDRPNNWQLLSNDTFELNYVGYKS